MRILFVAPKHDYGEPEQGLSFEHCNFFEALRGLGHDILYFDFPAVMARAGRDAMNARLRAIVSEQRPDLMFTVLWEEQLERSVIRAISESRQTITLNWFCDDHWRFEIFSRHWAPCFHWVVTTAQSAVLKYAAIGYDHAIKSQWGCNQFVYRKLDLPMLYDATFIGQPHGNRRRVIERIRAAGIDVRAWGAGWENGRCSHEAMIRIFNQSRINLNFSNSAPAKPSRTQALKGKLRGALSLGADALPFGRKIKAAAKRIRRCPEPDASRAGASDAKYYQQIKARVFEAAGCGGFLLTDRAENLEDYFELGREIEVFGGVDELVEKIRYYLSHDSHRREIAERGYQRILRQHTYAHRFAEIFKQIGLPGPAANAGPGRIQELL